MVLPLLQPMDDAVNVHKMNQLSQLAKLNGTEKDPLAAHARFNEQMGPVREPTRCACVRTRAAHEPHMHRWRTQLQPRSTQHLSQLLPLITLLASFPLPSFPVPSLPPSPLPSFPCLFLSGARLRLQRQVRPLRRAPRHARLPQQGQHRRPARHAGARRALYGPGKSHPRSMLQACYKQRGLRVHFDEFIVLLSVQLAGL